MGHARREEADRTPKNRLTGEPNQGRDVVWEGHVRPLTRKTGCNSSQATLVLLRPLLDSVSKVRNPLSGRDQAPETLLGTLVLRVDGIAHPRRHHPHGSANEQ